jgi:hypothetical protein
MLQQKIKTDHRVMNVGVGQTGSTCWFFSSLNIFLTSDNGLKILWRKLQETLPTLKPRERAYFNSNINAPCPYKGAVKKTSAIYFWKFLNQYICAVGGPGRLIPKSGLNAYLTKNVKWRANSTKEAKGMSGAHPSWELPAILGHLGFKVGRDFRMLNAERWRYKFKNNSWTAPILMYSGGGRTYNMRDLLLEKRGYDLTGAIVYVAPSLESNREPHVWACAIRNGKGYITDSNYPTTQIECSWWQKADLERHFMTVASPYRPGAARLMGFDVIMYTRKEFTNKITPTCQRTYRPLTANNEQKLSQFNKWGPGVVNSMKTGGIGNAHRMFSPRVLAEAIRQNSKRPLMTREILNNIVNRATSFQNGVRLARNAKNNNGRFYRINQNGPNYINFRKKLIARFPYPVPKNVFLMFWRNSKSNSDFVNRLRSYANRAGYTVNENTIKDILARRATTRAGVKRVRNSETERMYLVNNTQWRNSNGTNVTNKINPNNWVRTNNNNTTDNIGEYTNATNVKTFKRKVANFNKERAARALKM